MIVGAAGAIAFARTRVPYYAAPTKVLLYQGEYPMLLSTPMTTGQMPALDAVLGGNTTQMDLLKELVRSRTIQWRTLEKHGFLQDKRFTDHLPPGVEGKDRILDFLFFLVKVDSLGQISTVIVEWPDPILSGELSLALTEEAIAFFRENVSHTWEYIRKDLDRKQTTAEQALRAMSNFEKQHGISAIEPQTQRELSQEPALALRVIQLDREYQDLKVSTRFAIDPVEADAAGARMSANRRERAQVARELSRVRGFIKRMPEERRTYAVLREKVERSRLELATAKQKLEMVRPTLEANLSKYTILDKPFVPILPVRPQPKRLVLFGLLGGLFLGLALVMLQEDIERAKGAARKEALPLSRDVLKEHLE